MILVKAFLPVQQNVVVKIRIGIGIDLTPIPHPHTFSQGFQSQRHPD
jgi:hypothetical protein